MDTFFLIIMGITSITALTFIVERGLALRVSRVLPAPVVSAVEACRTTADRAVLRRVCAQSRSPLAVLLGVAEENLTYPREENEATVQSRARGEIIKLERGLVVLEIIVGIAPLLGLVGTIYGMMTLFGGLGESATGDNTVLAHGISLILRFTMMGLLIAIPALISWSYFTKKVETLTIQMESICSEFLRRQYQSQTP